MRTMSDLDVFSASADSSSFFTVSSSSRTRNIVVLGFSVGRPIFFCSLIVSPPFCSDNIIVYRVATKVNHALNFSFRFLRGLRQSKLPGSCCVLQPAGEFSMLPKGSRLGWGQAKGWRNRQPRTPLLPRAPGFGRDPYAGRENFPHWRHAAAPPAGSLFAQKT